ncbi:MAG: ATP-binding protein [Candidatus Aminicenantes bacterium]|nr:ATP-binding protein [Candidatus Aminicenantes bacterium]
MKNKISHKLIAVGIVTIAIVGIFSYFLTKSNQRTFILKVEHYANQLSEMIKSSTKSDMLFYRRERVHEIIDTIGQQEGIEKVRIFNKEGIIIYSSDKPVIGTMVDKRAEACYGCHTADQPLERLSISERMRIFQLEDEVRSLGIINPIYNEPSCWLADCHVHKQDQKVLGVLDVSMSLAEVDRLTRENQTKVVLLTIAAIILISVFLWFFFQRLITRPVQHIVAATNAVSAGNLSYKLEVKRNDELGHLGNSFNEMTHNLAEAQTQLYHSDKLASIGRLAAGVAHEINNPLTGVLTYSSFLLKRTKDDPELKSDLEIIVRETKRCREIVKDLLDFARPSSANRKFLNLNDVIERALSIVANQLSFNHVVVHKELNDSLAEASIDDGQLQQVFINLFVNASDAIGEKGGKLSLSSSAVHSDGKEYIQIKVTDTGCGIAKENLSKIFEPFYSTKDQKGTGLGLSVVWGIIDKHQGTISVESEIGKGSTITILIPVGQREVLIKKA